MGFSTGHVLIVALVILILFGSAAIPKFARSLGKAKSEFEKGVEDGKRAADAEPAKPADAAKPPDGDKPA